MNRIDFELQDDASGETGQSWAEDADMSGEVLNWKLSSLDFESISPQKGSAVSFDRGNGDVEALHEFRMKPSASGC